MKVIEREKERKGKRVTNEGNRTGEEEQNCLRGECEYERSL